MISKKTLLLSIILLSSLTCSAQATVINSKKYTLANFLQNKDYSIDLMFNYPYYKTPSTKARTKSAKVLLYELKNETKSLDFMMYGIYDQPDIFNEIVYLCHKPNIKLRGIVDVNTKGQNDYADTHKLKSLCCKIKTDFSKKDEMKNYYDKQKKLGYLMHNKVFVFSNNHVWTGSTNISSTCSGGYNANVAYLIKDRQVADLYRQEIEQMYEREKFHTDKEKIAKRNISLSDGTLLSVYFSPNEKIMNESILPSFRNAKKYIYIGMFYFTNQKLVKELISAHKRGVDVKVIVDASFANNYRYNIDIMRQEGIKVKVENWGGKMHCKIAVIDDEKVLTGSLNWTKSAVNFNDENFLEIKSKRIANESKNYLENLWMSIPDKWLKEIPYAEGLDSKNSCNDGIDNDHNNLTDKEDPKCIKSSKIFNK